MFIVDALKKIGAGAKFLAEHLWSALKGVFGSEKAKEITLTALNSAKELLATEFGAFVARVVTELEASTLEGPQRLVEATASIKAYLAQQEKELPTVWIHWAIETVLMFIRGLAKAE